MSYFPYRCIIFLQFSAFTLLLVKNYLVYFTDYWDKKIMKEISDLMAIKDNLVSKPGKWSYLGEKINLKI